MSDPRGGNGNQLGGGMNGALGSAALPSPGDNADSIDVPGLGKVDRGPTPLHTIHNHNRAVFDKLTTADRLLGRMREEMDKLSVMGDTVSPEDVVAGAGRLVGHGVPARELAAMLADMPTQAGQGLAAWVAQNEILLVQQEAHVAQAKAIAQHQMGVSAVRAMAAGDVMNQNRQQAASMGQLGPRARGAPPTPAPQPGASQGGVPEPQMLQMVGQGAQGQNGGGSS